MIAIPTIDAQILREVGDRAVAIDVEQYHGMIRAGILPDGAPIELLDGMLVRKDRSARGESPISIGLRHTPGVENAEALRPALERLGYWLRAQQPVELPPEGEPEPDGAIVRGPRTRYSEQRPCARDVCVIVEVADGTLKSDRSVKLRIYATAGISQYIITKLVDNVIEVYANPDPTAGTYGEPAIVPRDGTVTF